jgi:hypothetical protein
MHARTKTLLASTVAIVLGIAGAVATGSTFGQICDRRHPGDASAAATCVHVLYALHAG